jgi:RHS repeat-associated protein
MRNLYCIILFLILSLTSFKSYAQPGNPGDPDAQPLITGFTPASGPVGTSVTINGSGFNFTPSNNIVYFGATKATVTAATTTQLTVTVPAGATYQPISVLANGLTAYSTLPFATTYVGWGVIDAGTFTSKTDFPTGTTPYSVSPSDFDGDGKTDLAVVNFSSNTVSIFRNTSTGIGVAGYAAKVDYPTSSNPVFVSTGDLDGDGMADLAVANYNGNAVSIFRNTSTAGSISFAMKVDYATGANPYSVSIGDLDHDGKADLAVANFGSNTVSVFRNTSMGGGSVSFASKLDNTTGAGPWTVSIGDIDGDGKFDMAVANFNSSTISVFRNTGIGVGSIAFATKVDFATGSNPRSVSIGDLDNDGKGDLVASNYIGNTISVLRNTSTGAGSLSFAAKIDNATGANPWNVSIGDLDGDGKTDLAVADMGSHSLSVFRNTSSGAGSLSFAAKVDYVMGTNTSNMAVAIGDFDGDGKADLATGNYGNTTMSVILHPVGARQTISSFNSIPQKTFGDAPLSFNATASSGLPITYSSSNTSVATISGSTVTMVGYGTTTITATQIGDSYYGPTSVSQVLAVGPFPAITSFTPASGPVGTSVTINGSGFSATPANNIVYFGATKATVTAASTTQLTVTVPVGATHQPISVLTNGLIAYSNLPFTTTYVGWGVVDANTFNSKTDFATGTNPFLVSTGDFDGDGKTDLAMVNFNSSTVSIFRNTSTGPSIVSYGVKIDFASGANPSSVSVGDLDGDGKTDLAVTNYNGSSVSVFRNTSTGSGSISFAAKLDYPTGLIPYSVSIGDLDNDGKADLAVANYSSNTISILRNTGTGAGLISFAPKIDYVTGVNPRSTSIVDLDGDGKADLAVTNCGSPFNTVSVFRNTSTGMGAVSFAAKVDYTTGTSPYSVSTGDLDGDGKIDLATANYTSNTVSVLRNTSVFGALSFAVKVEYATGTNPESVAIGDLDGDGKSDLAVANYGANSLSIFRNTSTGSGSVSFGAKVDYVTGTNTSTISVAIGDFDGDGKADLAAANYGTATMSVILHPMGARQTISSFNPFPQKNFGDGPITLGATASSGLPVTYSSSNTSVATVSGNVVTIVGYGTTTITATQIGDSYYGPISATQVLAVGPFPTITSFTPASGPVGTSVTIIGSEFNATPSNNIVYFGPTKATVTAATATQLTVTVPVGATYQPITVEVNGLLVYSKLPFVTTYVGWGVIDADTFTSKTDLTTAGPPNSILNSDFDSDGKTDLAVANSSAGSVSVFRNTSTAIGAATYAPKVDFSSFGNASTVSAADVDGDGKNDLVVISSVTNIISILRNTSTGPASTSFANRVDYIAGTGPASVSFSDVDGDGKADMVVASFNSNVVSIFRNISSGPGSVNFANKVDYATGSLPYSVSIADLDGDGKVDVAVTNSNSASISVFRNMSTGMGSVSFAPKVDYATGGGPYSCSIGDVDNDGKFDLVVANYNSNSVSVLRNTSTGVGSIGFASAVSFATGANPRTVSMGDLDGDGKVDLAIGNYAGNSVSVLQNTSAGAGSVSYATKVDYSAGTITSPTSISIGDFDGDGKADLATANSGNNTISVILHPIGARQTISSFDPFPQKSFGDAPITLSATASSGLPITYSSSNTSVATVSGNIVTIVGCGTTTITATQVGDSYYGPVSVSLVLAVGPFPTITSFTPTSGPVGTTVTINGSGFSSTLANNIVYFGATKAIVTAATTSQLTVTVPVGATYQPITVLANGLLTYSKLPFTTTYVGWGVIDPNSFVSKTDFALVSLPFSVSAGDFDGDGKTDLAVSNNGSNTVSIFRNTSNSAGVVSYAAKIDIVTASGSSPNSISVGDLDGDGKMDIAVTNNSANTVSIFRNTSTVGAVNFATKVDYATGTSPQRVSIGDLDGDGRADLVVGNVNGNTISLFRNTSTAAGSVNFAAKVDYAVGGSPYSISIGDLDGDGKADLAVTNYNSSIVSLFRNTSTGMGSVSFAAKVDYTTGANPISISIGDLDGDGKVDLAVTNYTGNTISILLNTSVTGSVSFAAKVDYATGTNPRSVSIGDLDGDGKSDLAVANYGSHSLSMFRNTSTVGSVGYDAKVDYVTGTNTNPYSVSIGDFDGDGKADLAAANYGNATMSVILHSIGARQTISSFNPFPQKSFGDTPITLSATASSGLPVTYTSSNTSVATISGNTITMVGYGTTTITAIQAGDSYYGPVSVSQLLAVGPFPTITSFAPASGPVGTSVTINGSGFSATPVNNTVYFGATKATVTAASTSQLTVTVPVGTTYQPISVEVNGLLAYSKLPFSTTYVGWGVIDANAFIPKTDFATGSNPYSVSTGDFDGDGKTDLAVINYTSATVSILRNTSTGAGTASYATKVDFATGVNPIFVSIGDLDGDGKPDLAVANYAGNSVSVLRNTSTGTGSINFAAKVDYAASSNVYSVSIGDLDGDGRADLAVPNFSGNSVSIFRNTSTSTGSMSFATKMDYATGGNPYSASMGDLDGDGKVDLAVANYAGSSVSVFRNTSTGMGLISLAAKVDFATGTNPRSLSLGDLDGDGKIDLSIANFNGNSVSVLHNTSIAGSMSFAAKIDYTSGTGPYSVSIGDLDGDGKSDLLVANYTSSSLSMFQNTSAAGSVNFTPKVDLILGVNLNTSQASIGDFDGDGKADLVATNYATGVNTVSVVLHATGARQTISSFNPIPQKSFGDAPFTLSATASSGLPISYSSSNISVATVSGNTVTIVGYGTTIITATQAGDSYYGPISATQVLAVGPFPTITSFTPASGPVGTSVVINGSGFSATPANNTVFFGANKATITAATTSQLTVIVPVGATYQPITVLTNGLTGYSSAPFLTTYTGWGMIDATSFIPKVDFSTGANPYSASPGDFDGDGKIDLAVATSVNATILRNTGTALGMVSYASKLDFSAGSSCLSLSVGDLNGDGKADLAVANNQSNTVSVFRNTSTGSGSISFASKIDYPVGSGPQSVSIGDFDGDGKADLVVANYYSGTISILHNTGVTGSINFATKIDYATGSGPISVVTKDLDGDGKVDIEVANFSSNTVSIFRNTSTAIGSTTFATKTDFSTGTNPYWISIGDLDSDGKADLAVANNGTNNISVLRNTSVSGSVGFATKVDFATGTNPRSISIGDLDGDGKADMAVGNYGSNSLSLFHNTSTGIGSINYAPKIDYTIGTNPTSVFIEDIDGDGKADLAATNYISFSMSVILHSIGGATTQTISSFNPFPSKSFGDAPFALSATASSGLPITYSSSNASVATVTGNTVTIVGYGTTTITAIQTGDISYAPVSVSQVLAVGPFPTITNFTPASGPVGTSITIDGSGFSDTPASNIVYFGATKTTATAATTSQLTVTVPVGATYQPITILTNGLIAYSAAPFVTTYTGWGVIDASTFVSKTDFATGAAPRFVSAGDFDGDGKTDLAVANTTGNTVSIFRNTGISTGSVSFATKIDYATGSNPYSISAGDFDGDGKTDLAIVNSGSNTVSIYLNTSTGVGSISFAAKIDYATGATPYSVSTGDFDGDGKADLAVANSGSNTVSVFLNTSIGVGSISFATKMDYTTGSLPYWVSIGDLDNDGKSDLAVASYGSSKVSLFRNTSTGIGSLSFAAKIDYTTGSNPSSVSVGDLDGDGKADLAVANYAGNTVSLLRNTSTGAGSMSFATKLDYAVGTNPRSISIGDLDGDGKMDLAVANYTVKTVSLLQNTSSGTGSVSFAAKVDYAMGGNANTASVSIGDFDGDGKADLAMANPGNSNISVMLHKADQTITFSPLPSSVCYAAQSFALNATASSGLPVTFSSNNTSVATINGNTITIVGAGVATITANQVGNNNFRTASVPQTITINPSPTTFNLTLQSPYCQGTTGAVVALSGSENNTQYTLYNNGTSLSTIAGPGSELTWTQLTQSGAYTVNALSNSGCSSSMNGSVNINFILLPPASITGPSSIDDASITLTAPAGYTYTWSMTSGEVIQQSSLSSLIVTAAGEYQVVVNSSGCTTTSAPHLVSGTFTPNFNGNISVASWRTQAAYATGNSDYKGMYIYKYDEKSQLKEAQFAVPDFATHTFVPAGNNFHETGYTYDPNGNIQTLRRYDGAGNKIHDLTYIYSYDPSLPQVKYNNMLQSVKNNGGNFRDYHYNEIGQMASQDNATGADQIVDYDVTGKVTDVYSNADRTKKTTHYTYDDRGFRLSKETYDNANHLQFTTWYIRDAGGNVMSIYDQQANDSNISLSETPIYGSGKLGVYRTKPNGGGEYVYELTDQLGNVRATIKNETTVYLATMEDNGTNDMSNPRVTENGFFKNLFETQQRDTRMNHTPASTAVPSPGNTSYLNWTSGISPQNMIGAGITLKVESGDQVNMEAWAKFQHNASYTRDATPAMMASLLSAMFLGANGLESSLQATQDFANGIPMTLAGTSSDPGTKPYAYLNYLVFDKNFVFQDGGAARLKDEAGFDAGLEIAVSPQLVNFTDPIKIKQSGYIYVWVSNESENTKVWWDDLKVTLTGSRVTQATDYYPFGLVMREQSVPTVLEYRYKYQGQNAEKDDETGWEHFELREYDPIIGRWLVPDPKRQYWSPYVAMGNNPVNLVDPDGGDDGDPKEGDINEAGNLMYSKGQWTQLLQEVVVTASISNFTKFTPQPVPQDATRFVIQNSYSYPVFEDKGYGLQLVGGTGQSYGPGGNLIGKKTIAERQVDIRLLLLYLDQHKTTKTGVSGDDINEVMKKTNDAVHNVPVQETYDTLYKGNVYTEYGYDSYHRSEVYKKTNFVDYDLVNSKSDTIHGGKKSTSQPMGSPYQRR